MALVARIAAGDEGSMGALYDRFASLLYSLSFAITRREQDAENAVAASFRRVWNEASTFDSSGESVAAWLTSLVRREALAVRGAAERRQVVRLESENEAPVFSAIRAVAPRPREGEAGPAPLVAEVALALGGLSEVERRAIELAYFRGLEVPQIASQLGESEYNVGTRLRSAMEHLRVSLASHSTVSQEQPVTRA